MSIVVLSRNFLFNVDLPATLPSQPRFKSKKKKKKGVSNGNPIKSQNPIVNDSRWGGKWNWIKNIYRCFNKSIKKLCSKWLQGRVIKICSTMYNILTNPAARGACMLCFASFIEQFRQSWISNTLLFIFSRLVMDTFSWIVVRALSFFLFERWINITTTDTREHLDLE